MTGRHSAFMEIEKRDNRELHKRTQPTIETLRSAQGDRGRNRPPSLSPWKGETMKEVSDFGFMGTRLAVDCENKPI